MTSSFNLQYNLDRVRNTIRKFYEQCETATLVKPQVNTDDVAETERVDVPKKEYRGNQYDLDQFLYRQSQIQYYASLAKNKKDIKQVEKVAVEFNSDEFDKRRYLKKWHRVDDFAKQIASKQYLDKLLATERITSGEHQRLQKEIRTLIQTKSLKKVDYDEQSGILYGIEQLNLPSIR
jgi:hypothetical protein